MGVIKGDTRSLDSSSYVFGKRPVFPDSFQILYSASFLRFTETFAFPDSCRSSYPGPWLRRI